MRAGPIGGDVDVLEDGAGAGGLGPRRGRRRKPREKEVPIEFLPKVRSIQGLALNPRAFKPYARPPAHATWEEGPRANELLNAGRQDHYSPC